MNGALLVQGGTVVLPTGPERLAIAIQDGRIQALGLDARLPAAGEIIDATGLWVLPGLIDMHVHFRDPGLTHKEDFDSGTQAALAGGVTTVCDMPNTVPPVTAASAFFEKLEAIAPKARCDFALWAGGGRTEDFPSLAAAGAIGIKVYQTRSTAKGAAYSEELFIDDDETLLDVFESAAACGLPVALHADNFALAQRERDRLKREGRRDLRALDLLRRIPATTEGMVKALLFAHHAKAHLHVAHISLGAPECVDWVREAKTKGHRVTAECPPVWLTLEDLDRVGPYGLPFALPREEIDVYWRALADGSIDALATDHAPHTAEEKNPGWEDVWQAPTGYPAVELLLSLAVTKMREGLFGERELVRMTAEAPARILGLYPRKGTIQLGADADLTLVDLQQSREVRSEELRSRAGWSPFEGMRLWGWPVMTILRGRVVMREREILGRPGFGQLVAPLGRAVEVRDSQEQREASAAPKSR